MKYITNNIYQFFIVLILFAGILALVFINHYKKNNEREYLNENILTLGISYQSSIDKYRLLSKYIFNESINNELVLSLFEKGINSTGEEKKLYKGLLFRELYPLYLRLKEEGIRQLHFHTKNNESYIRFHQPDKYGDDLSLIRKTVKFVNDENKAITSFEAGRVISGFRNVFPINFKNEHLGSVEISISTKMMVEAISNLDSRKEYAILLNKDIVFDKLFKNQSFLYQESVLNSDFVIEDINSSLSDSPKILSDIAKKINEKLHNNKQLKKAMNKGEKYAAFVKLDDIYYDVTLIPMPGISKKIEGYLIGYQKSINIPIMISLELYAYSLVILGIIIFISMLLIIQRKTTILDNERKWFKSITDNLVEGLYVMDSNAKINYINPNACKILGYKEEEILGKNAHNLFHSHYLNDNMKQADCTIFKGVMKNKYFTSKKEYFLDSKGVNIPVALNSKLVLSPNSEIEIVTSFSDISIQKELEDKSNLLIKALESSINSIVITNKDAYVQWANPAFEELTGFKINEIIGKNPKEFISSKKQTEEFYSQMWGTILDKKPWKGELINKKKDGTLYDEELIITPVLDEKDEIIHFIAIKQDISNRKLLALEKEEKDKIFFQQSKLAAMGEMLGNIAHQWRQPLSAITTASTGIKLQKEMNCLSDEDFNYAMNTINNSAQYLSATIDDFRSFFDPNNDKKKKFLLSKMIDKILNIINLQFVTNDIEIIKNIENITILSLENELMQVLLNILNNARDALLNLEDKKKLIFINAYTKDNFVVIEIKDNAKGIKEEIMDRIFEPYFTTKHQSQGTGIGLYMSQNIVKNYLNGTLKVSNENYVYKGSSYTGAKFTIII
jgi:PAS domain S-box-containing protein